MRSFSETLSDSFKDFLCINMSDCIGIIAEDPQTVLSDIVEAYGHNMDQSDVFDEIEEIYLTMKEKR